MFVNQLIKSAFDRAGLSDINSDSINGDEFGPAFRAFGTVIDKLNNDPEIVFGWDVVNFVANGNTFYFQPLSADEVEDPLLAGIRIYHSVPTIAPKVIIDGFKLDQMSIPDIVSSNETQQIPSSFAFSKDWDRAYIYLSTFYAGQITFTFQKSIEVPLAPTDLVKVPPQYINYLTIELAHELALIYQQSVETLAILGEWKSTEKRRIQQNLTLDNREVDISLNLNRYQRGFGRGR